MNTAHDQEGIYRSVADTLGLIVTDQQDRNRYEGSRRRLQALIDASLALGESRDLPTLLGRILDLATTHVGADRGAIFRRDVKTGDLTASIFHGDELAQIAVSSGHGIVGQVAESGTALRLADAYDHADFDRTVDERTGYRTRSLIAVPMQLRTGEVIGVVELLNKNEGEFDDDDEAFLKAFGAQAAVALENARLTEERIRGERLEAVGAVSASLVHDLKNPLSGVHGYTDVILQQPPPELLERCVQGIRRQTLRMNHMVSSILRYVRGEDSLLVSKTNFNTLLEEIVEDLRAAHAADGVSIAHEAEPVGTVRLDPMAMRRVVDNLCRNAAEAMDGKGTITLRVAIVDEDVLLEIADDGPGMDPQRVEALFAPWETAGKQDGTGLGLAIVRRIVDRHGGSIAVDSRPGHGTTFRIRVPFAGPPDDA